MPVKVTMTADGIWAWIAQNQAAVRADKVKTAMRKAQAQAFRDWANLKGGDVGLALRFEKSAFGVLGLSERSTGYMRQQSRTIGGIYPYVAPLRKGGGGGAPSGTMRRLVLGGEGRGWNVTNKNGGGNTVSTLFTLPGAKQLNVIKEPRGSTYRREFLGLDRGGRRDAQWITQRSNALTREFLTKEFMNARKAYLRLQGAA